MPDAVFSAGLALGAAAVLGVSFAAGQAWWSRDERIRRARRRDDRRVRRARARTRSRAAARAAREEADRQAKLRRAARGEDVGQVRVQNAPPLPRQAKIPPPPGATR